MTNWRYKTEWSLWETCTAGRIEIDVFSVCSKVSDHDFDFVTESCLVRYSTSLDGASNSQLGFFDIGGQT